MNFIGPFLGMLTQTSVRVWVHIIDDIGSLPKNLTVEADGKTAAFSATGFERYSVMVADLSGLKPGNTYNYQLKLNGSPEPSLAGADLQFTTLPASESDIWSFALLTCHNPFEYEKKHAGQGWRMWKSMPDQFWGSSNSNLRFALLGGDQIYTDPLHNDLRYSTSDDERRKLFIKLYQMFWNDPSYQKVMRKLPSAMMWDDHDIYDGWGSFDIPSHSDGGKIDWPSIFSEAKSAFAAFQGSRNPPALSPTDDFSFAFIHDNIGFITPDLRTNRNFLKNQIWSDAERTRVYSWLDNEGKDLDHIFIVSTVTFFHLSPTVDALVDAGYDFFEWIKDRHNVDIDPLDEIEDDLLDSWDSTVNLASMLDFARKLFDWQNAKLASTGQPRTVYILTGDIHNGGMSDLLSHDPGHAKQPYIRQIISSPVSYVAEPKFACAFLQGLMNPTTYGNWLTCQHRHLFPQRNYCVINIERTDDGHSYRRFRVKFYREGIEEPHETVLPIFPQKLVHLDWQRYSQ